jgi:hypothetical protein
MLEIKWLMILIKRLGNNNNDQINKGIDEYEQIEIELLSEDDIKIENNIQLIADNVIQGNEEFVIESMQLNYFSDIAKHCQQTFGQNAWNGKYSGISEN